MNAIKSTIRTIFTDRNGIPYRWSYNSQNKQHITALQSFIKYLDGHNLSPRSVRHLHVQDEYVRYTIEHQLSLHSNTTAKHYLTFPPFINTFDTYPLSRGINLSDFPLDPNYHHRCPFGYSGGSCAFCQTDGANATTPPN